LKGYVLVINPGSTSTKVAIYLNNKQQEKISITHDINLLKKFDHILEQLEFRKKSILDWVKSLNIDIYSINGVVARGGLLRPMPSGIYKISERMLEDLKTGIQGEHASNLGGIIAYEIARIIGVSAYIADPVAVDEFMDVARISGIPEIPRRSLVHALNIRAVGRIVAGDMNTEFNNFNMIIAHIGGGISVVPILNGKMIDANNANQMGPFSPERSGGLPVGDLINMCFSGNYSESDLLKKIVGDGGLRAYLGTNDVLEIETRIKEKEDAYAREILEAMAYQIAKEIGAMASVLNGEVDIIVITGGLAYSEFLVSMITKRISFIAPIICKAGEDEMDALYYNYKNMIEGKAMAKEYENEVYI